METDLEATIGYKSLFAISLFAHSDAPTSVVWEPKCKHTYCTITAELPLNNVITDTQNTKGSVFLHFIVKLIKYLSFFYQQTGLGNGFVFVQGSALKHLTTVVSEWLLLRLLQHL